MQAVVQHVLGALLENLTLSFPCGAAETRAEDGVE
jgi:hypothetical protein